MKYKARLYRNVGRRVRERRLAAGVTQDQLAKRLRVTRVTVSNIECGVNGPSVYTLHRIAVELRTTAGRLLPATRI